MEWFISKFGINYQLTGSYLPFNFWHVFANCGISGSLQEVKFGSCLEHSDVWTKVNHCHWGSNIWNNNLISILEKLESRWWIFIKYFRLHMISDSMSLWSVYGLWLWFWCLYDEVDHEFANCCSFAWCSEILLLPDAFCWQVVGIGSIFESS